MNGVKKRLISGSFAPHQVRIAHTFFVNDENFFHNRFNVKLVELPGYVQTTFFLVCEKSAMTSTLVDLQIKIQVFKVNIIARNLKCF